MLELTHGTILENRYTVLRPLGRGGMGTVYLAEDSRLNRQCAVKMALRTDPEAKAQFRREAGFLANLHHNNLPRVIDYFAQGDRYFLVMDYVQGRDFGQIVTREGPQPESRVLQWLPQILDALEYLHGQKPQPIVHRDVKPANIKLTPSGRVMLVDFGIAKRYDPLLSTVAGARGFSPGFSPPEQYGQGRTDARSDIFSLGATLYYLLTGVVPTDAASRMAGARLTPPRQHNPRISPATERAILKAMEMDCNSRFPSLQEFRQALTPERPATPLVAPTVSHRPPARAASAAARPAPPRRRPSSTVIAIAAVTLILAAVAGVLFVRNVEPQPLPPSVGIAPGAGAMPTSSGPARAAMATLRPVGELRPGTTRMIGGIEFVYVPAGEFTMGEGDEEHTVTLDAFWISKTEVTNAQYRAFVEAGGYQQQELWTEAGWVWKEDGDRTEPEYWDNSMWNQSAYPVVGVSWYEAVAYARWLAQETGLEVRLPTEAEWEKAARGTDGRTYPWGEEPPDGTRLNYCDRNCEYDWKDEAVDDEYRYTAPAGSYPAGPSPYGALDMAGNVWEWTSSLIKGYPYRVDDGREEMKSPGGRVGRGGSWADLQSSARCASRDWDYPSFSIGSIGFRLVSLVVLDSG